MINYNFGAKFDATFFICSKDVAPSDDVRLRDILGIEFTLLIFLLKM